MRHDSENYPFSALSIQICAKEKLRVVIAKICDRQRDEHFLKKYSFLNLAL